MEFTRRVLRGTEGEEQPTEDLAYLFECPVCFDYVLPPIMQCNSGHLICSLCRPKLHCCPNCRGPLGSVRNLAMEKVAETITFPCKFTHCGCTKRLYHREKREHEERCECRPYPCPVPGSSCKWQGGLEGVMSHLSVAHKTITILSGEDIVFLATDVTLHGAVDWVMLQSCFSHHFMLVLEKQERHEGHQQFFAVVMMIGSSEEALNFTYRLELFGSGGRKLVWEAHPHSIQEGVSNVTGNSDCLIFETSMIPYFCDHGNLPINVTISQTHPNPSPLVNPSSMGFSLVSSEQSTKNNSLLKT